MHVRRILTCLAVVIVTAVGAVPVASAQNQSGLVNVAIVDNTVQIPIAVAANVCGVTINVLSQNIAAGDTTCDAVADATATRAGGAGGGGGANQQGLVNLYVADNVIQVPVGIAANLCGISANVLAQDVTTGTASCDAQGNAGASG
jgi:hypothetical protein